MIKIIDVSPSGWMYGFPRKYDFEPSHPNLPGEEHHREFRQWLMDCGYPAKLMKEGSYRLRFWDYAE